MLFFLWFSNVFLTFRSSSTVCVLGAVRHIHTCAASRGPLPPERVVRWNGTPPLASGRVRSARIRPREVGFPLVFKGF